MDFPVGIGPLHPHFVFDLVAYAAGFQMFLWLRRRGDPLGPLRPWMVLAAFVGALLGAKLLAWLIDPVATWQGRADWHTWAEGKTVAGALLGGLIAVEWTKKRMGIVQATGDLYAIPLVVGIAIGRIGCFLSGLPDRTHGIATGLGWGVDFGDGILRHPTQLYEMVFLLTLLAGLIWQRRAGHVPGLQFATFMVAYLGWRLAVGFIQPLPTWGLSAIQWACAAGLIYYGLRWRKMQAQSPTATDAPGAAPAEAA